MDIPPFIARQRGSSLLQSEPPSREEPQMLAALMSSILMLGMGTERTAAIGATSGGERCRLREVDPSSVGEGEARQHDVAEADHRKRARSAR